FLELVLGDHAVVVANGRHHLEVLAADVIARARGRGCLLLAGVDHLAIAVGDDDLAALVRGDGAAVAVLDDRGAVLHRGGVAALNVIDDVVAVLVGDDHLACVVGGDRVPLLVGDDVSVGGGLGVVDRLGGLAVEAVVFLL